MVQKGQELLTMAQFWLSAKMHSELTQVYSLKRNQDHSEQIQSFSGPHVNTYSSVNEIVSWATLNNHAEAEAHHSCAICIILEVYYEWLKNRVSLVCIEEAKKKTQYV